jgi:hypothetical protein
MRLEVHFGSGDVLARGRQEHAPQVSENLRQSASDAQAVVVPGSGLACEAEGAGTTGGTEAEGAAAGISTAGVALGAGESSRSPRLHPPANGTQSTAAHARTARTDFFDEAERTVVAREGRRGIAAA